VIYTQVIAKKYEILIVVSDGSVPEIEIDRDFYPQR